MGIDVFCTDLASHFLGFQAAALDLVARDWFEASGEGLRRSLPDVPRNGRSAGPVAAWLAARRVVASFEDHALRAGNPFAGIAGSFAMEPDRLDSGGWLDLFLVFDRVRVGNDPRDAWNDLAVTPAPEVGARPRSSFFEASWDGVPGIAFARAIGAAQGLVLPSANSIARTTAGIVFCATVDASQFLDEVDRAFALDASVLGRSYDPDASQRQNAVLYNLALLRHQSRTAESTGRPMGVWG